MLRAQLREAEVEHLHLLARRDEDVCRFDIAVHDAVRMRGVERVGNLNRDLEHGADRRADGRRCADRGLPLQQLHRDELGAFVLVDVVNRADVRVVERRRGPRFALEAIRRSTRRGCGRQAGTSARTVRDSRMSSACVDDAHTSGADDFEDAVMGDGLADHLGKFGAYVALHGGVNPAEADGLEHFCHRRHPCRRPP
jgi:hypothetical protein